MGPLSDHSASTAAAGLFNTGSKKIVWFRTSQSEPETFIAGAADGAGTPLSLAAVAEASARETASAVLEMPLSPGRARLASAIAALAAAREAFEVASLPVQRLQAVISKLTRTSRDLAELDRAHEQLVGEWLGCGSTGEKPLPPAHRLGLAQRRDELATDATAAQATLPTAQALEHQAAGRCQVASWHLEEAIAAAASDAAAELLPELRDRLKEFLAVERKLRSVETVLRTAGNKNEMGAYFIAATAISDAIAAIKRDTGATIDVAVGERLLAGLASDPKATLQ
jgi:hypothetical protein